MCIQIPEELLTSYALFQPNFLSLYNGDDQQVDEIDVENCGRECTCWHIVGTGLALVKSGEKSRYQVHVVQDSLATNIPSAEQLKQNVEV